MDLVTELRKPEGKTLEFKRDLSSPDAFLRTVVAFANTAGGIILIGVEDVTRNVRGVSNPLSLEERVASLISDSIAPRLLPDLAILTYRNLYVIGVQVHPSSNRPHFLTRAGMEGGTYVRVGSTNRKADSSLIGEMQRFARGDTFDERPMPDLDSEAVDFRVASESFAPVRKLTRRDLETLRLITSYQGRKVPTVAGVLLFGTERLRHFPDAWIQAGRFEGKDKANIIDYVDLRMPLMQAIDAVVGFVEKHSTRRVTIGRVHHSDRWSLPPAAVREAVINAVVHADYSQQGAPIRISIFDDRLEVENPGLLPFGLTVDDIQLGVSKLRNRAIGRVFHDLGLVEQWGSGVQRMRAACQSVGLASPEFIEIGTRFRVTIHTSRVGAPELSAIDRTILALVDVPEGRATHQVADGIGLTPRTARTRLAALVKLGLIREIGTSQKDPRRRYFKAD